MSTSLTSWLTDRNAKFAKYESDYLASLEAKEKKTIKIELPDGTIKEGIAWETTPRNIAEGISNSLAKAVCVAKVAYDDASLGKDTSIAQADGDASSDEESGGCCNGQGSDWVSWDAGRVLEGDCKLKLIKFEDPEGRHVFWHSSAHVLGGALERSYGVHLTIGPALERGFYYDCHTDFSIKESDYEKIEKAASEIVKENQQFVRIVVSKEAALDIFSDNKFKVELITNKIPDGGYTSLYRCGDLIDLCRGPHLQSTGQIKAFSVEKHSSTYWLGNAANESLQRVYAISFPDQKQLKQHQKLLALALERDHRNVGQKMNMFMFHDLTPGSAFWFGNGAKIYNTLCEFIRREYTIRGFEEVLTPNMFSSDLFKISGHWQNYKDDMFTLKCEEKDWGLKPMNCPGHCLIFKQAPVSYKQLPWRMAEFGVLHRNEASGALSGLTRVRRFVQDDAHIFCAQDQIKSEVKHSLDFVMYVYKLFGFEYEIALSTRPKKALGEKALWDVAEAQLKDALDESGLAWKLNAGDGAFYGPKIDIRLKDCLGRLNQCGTVQLDFQLPIRFDLSYRTSLYGTQPKEDDDAAAAAVEGKVEDKVELKVVDGSLETPLKFGTARPVIIHRAVLGSLERFTAIALEHFGARFPFWLSPNQIRVLPISEKFFEYARWVEGEFAKFRFNVDMDSSNNTINKKVRNAQNDQVNIMLIVGEQEQSTSTVTVRIREAPQNQKQQDVKSLLDELLLEKDPMSRPMVYKPFEG